MAYNNASRTFTVSTDDELNAAIANVDAIGKTGNNNDLQAGDYTIQFTQDITLDGTTSSTYGAQNADGTVGSPLTLNSGPALYTVAGSSQLYALNLSAGVRVTIDGNGKTLDGNSANTTGAQAYNGFFVYNGQVNIQNTTIANTVAKGGDGGGGGAGLGGGLFVAGPNTTGFGASTATEGGNVVLTNVNFAANAARGGAGVAGGAGGGLQGGSTGGDGAGGVGVGASGAAPGGRAGGGLILGAAPGSGANGGSNGGGGDGGSGGVGGDGASAIGGFGGGGGIGGFGIGQGGFGGGSGYGLNFMGGFGGFGGGSSGLAGQGGFGGGRGSGFGSTERMGGGGLGAGADVFVQQGGSLTIQGNSTLGAGTVVGGSSSGATAGAGLGSGLFIQGNQSVVLAPGAGQTLTVNGVIADQSGSQPQLAPGQGFSAGSGGLTIGAGTVVLAPVAAPGSSIATANTYTGGTSIAGGGALQLTGQAAAGTGAITFASLSGGATARLSLTQSAQPAPGDTFTNMLANFGAGSLLDLQGLTSASVSYSATTSQITVTGLRSGAQISQVFTLSNPGSTSFIAESDGQGGTLISVCFVAGVRIRTTRGDIAVEEMKVNDRIITPSGTLRPVTWLGHRRINGRGRALPASQQPVRVRAGAFGPGLPTRDLRLSPGHPVLVGADANGAGGHLVPIMCLINGTTIARELVSSVTYWHVELDAHDILLAEGLAAESYLDWGDRPFFTEGSDHALHNPDFVVPGLAARCRPVAVEGPVVEAERARLSTVFADSLGEACAWDEAGRFAWIAA